MINMSGKKITALVLLFGVVFFIGCHSVKKETIQEKYDKHPVKTIRYWDYDWRNTPLGDRIDSAPAELVEYIDLDNRINGYTEVPETTTCSDELRQAFESIVKSMPDNICEILEQRLIGIYAVKDLGTSGYAEAIKDKDGQERYAIIVLDNEILSLKKANEWATWRENSFFVSTEGANKVDAVIETEDNETTTNAVRYILLHEIGHVLGLVCNIHPSWNDTISKGDIVRYPFLEFSWTVNEEDKVVSKFDESFPERSMLRAYSFDNSKIQNADIASTYQNFLNRTDFVSLYAATNLWDDFAESFTIYFHTIIDKRPWQMTIHQQNAADIVIKPCWEDGRCTEKMEFMDKWFEQPGNLMP